MPCTSLTVYARTGEAGPQQDLTAGRTLVQGHQGDHLHQEQGLGPDLHSSRLPIAQEGGLEMMDTEEEVLLEKEVHPKLEWRKVFPDLTRAEAPPSIPGRKVQVHHIPCPERKAHQ